MPVKVSKILLLIGFTCQFRKWESEVRPGRRQTQEITVIDSAPRRQMKATTTEAAMDTRWKVFQVASVEHLHRRADGGTSHWSNLAMACTRCNNSRGERDRLS
ncbi:HNH endonuclease [Sinorhizobium meliloti]|uniref:HNH endonuclease n=1 Tax=Rhizobium meliloti TaxID=382 RepID=UPI00398D3D2B